MPLVSREPSAGKLLVGDSAPLDSEDNAHNDGALGIEQEGDLDFRPFLRQPTGKVRKTVGATSFGEILSATHSENRAFGSVASQGGSLLAQSISFKNKSPTQFLNTIMSLRKPGSVRSLDGDVEETYELLSELGRGAAGVVRLAKHRETGAEVAIKSVPLPEDPEDIKEFEQEFAIAQKLKHPNIVRLHGIIKDIEGYHLVMELCLGGTLYDLIDSQKAWGGQYKVASVAFCSYALQMLSGAAYLHHHRIVHRDIKPENYVLETREPNSPLKLADFGLACDCPPGTFLSAQCGTLYTMAPEVLFHRYTEKCDVWSVGCTLYYVVTARSPFWGEDVPLVEQAIKVGKATYGAVWCEIDERAERLVRQLLTVDSEMRPSAKAALAEHRWLLEGAAAKTKCCFLF